MRPFAPLPLWARRLVLAALAGCQGEKNVAHIGATTITEKVFNDRTQHIMQSDMLPIVDAGGSTLTRMILEEAVGQIAKEKGVEPTPQAVTAFTNYQVKYDPNKRRAIEQGVLTAADFEPTARYNMEIFAIGTDGAKAKPEDIQKEYDQDKAQSANPINPTTGQPGQNPVKTPAELTIRVVVAKTEALAAQALAQLKTNDDFKAAAQLAGVTGPSLDVAGQEAPFPEQLKAQLPDVYAAILQTPAGQYVSKPIPIPNAKTPQQFLVAKVVKNTPETLFTLEEARPLLEQVILYRDKPEWDAHETTLVDERLRKMLSDGSVQINIPRYQNITTKILPLLMDESEKAMKQRTAQRAQAALQQAQMQAQQAAPKAGAKPTAPPAPKAGGKP